MGVEFGQEMPRVILERRAPLGLGRGADSVVAVGTSSVFAGGAHGKEELLTNGPHGSRVDHRALRVEFHKVTNAARGGGGAHEGGGE